MRIALAPSLLPIPKVRRGPYGRLKAKSGARQSPVSFAAYQPPSSIKPTEISMKRFYLALPLALVLGAGIAHADGDRCAAPRDQWQPEHALRARLEADHWRIRRIKVEDGCYEVYAIDAAGNRKEGRFDPRTLQPAGTDGDS
jgi:hypothetical protein